MLPETMKAWVHREYGSPDVLHIEDMPVPVPADDEILVKMCSTTFAPATPKMRSGFYRKMFEIPFPFIPGADVGGEVVAVGKNVTRFKVGDRAMAFNLKDKGGIMAEYCAVKESFCGQVPPEMELSLAGAMCGCSLTARQGLYDEAKLQAGERILIIGAAGGVGQYAVQFAKLRGAYVIGCDVEETFEAMKKAGADEVVAASAPVDKKVSEKVDVIYSLANFTEEQLMEYLKLLNEGGRFVSANPLVGKVYAGPEYDGKKGKQSTPLSLEAEKATGKKCIWMIVKQDGERCTEIANMVLRGEITVTFDRVTTFPEFKQLNEDYEAGKTRGRIQILIDGYTR